MGTVSRLDDASYQPRLHAERIREALGVLAAPIAEQRAYVKAMGTPESCEELAHALGDVWCPGRMDVRALGFDAHAVERIDAVDGLLLQLAEGEEELWHVSALADARWNAVREAARRALDLL